MTPTRSPSTSRKSAPPGAAKSASRPRSAGKRGVGAKGNSGITTTVVKTPGAIGYISASYLIAAGLGAAAVQNKAGNYELPNLENIESAASSVSSVPASNAISITNPPSVLSAAKKSIATL